MLKRKVGSIGAGQALKKYKYVCKRLRIRAGLFVKPNVKRVSSATNLVVAPP